MSRFREHLIHLMSLFFGSVEKDELQIRINSTAMM